MVKNRLARLAVKDSRSIRWAPTSRGPPGSCFTAKDPVTVAKALQAFVRTNPALTIKVGWWRARWSSPPS